MKALICIDLIYEIMNEHGLMAQKGYADFAKQHGTLRHVADLQKEVRAENGRVFHVHLGFLPDYADAPNHSPLMAAAPKAGILQAGTKSTTIVPEVAPQEGDIVLLKKRISPFYETGLEMMLRTMGVTEVILAGVATDIAIQSTARDAHDRDFVVTVAAHACAAATHAEHETALANMAKFAKIRQ